MKCYMLKPSNCKINLIQEFNGNPNSRLLKVLVRYEFNCQNYHQAHKQVKSQFVLYRALMFMSLFINNFIYLGLALLLNKSKTKVQVWETN